MYCSQCGTELAPDAAFCSKCGKAVTSESPAPVAEGKTNRPKGDAIGRLLFAGLIGLCVYWFVSAQMAPKPRSTTRDSIRQTADAILGNGGGARAAARPRVTYRVYGAGTSVASLTYENGQGGTEQRGDQRISPAWELEFTAESGQFVYIAAQNASDSGSVTCEIRVDGAAFKHSASQGAYAIASCSGSVP